MKYFQMTYSEDNDYEPYGVAYAAPDVDPFLLPISGTKIESWSPLSLELRDGEFADYLTNDLGVRLCSENLQKIIENNRSENDQLQWLEAIVSDVNGHCKKYFVLHFPENYSVINKEKSIMAGDMIVKPVLNISIVKSHNIFTLPGEAGRTIFVSECLKKIIDKIKLSGLAFTKVSAV
ncbi:imm11 family protein [Desulforegula conservatrix]|uniref:imm11 family protein n=1 Tax=Desulforegula conservatrix TaxID=153026 RepID=UPI0004893A3A|nr:DUF1629 domain-containing protein [Desulforegula conservatrix]